MRQLHKEREKGEKNRELENFSSPFSDLYSDYSSKLTTYSDSAGNFTSDRLKKGVGGKRKKKGKNSKIKTRPP